jgi:hypothetical protein
MVLIQHTLTGRFYFLSQVCANVPNRETTDRVLEVLKSADEPLSASAIQHRIATRSRDMTTGIIRDVCKERIKSDMVEATDDVPPAYRLVDG